MNHLRELIDLFHCLYIKTGSDNRRNAFVFTVTSHFKPFLLPLGVSLLSCQYDQIIL